MSTTEKYLKPEVIRQVKRLDLRAKFIIEGFISGLHASPFHGFSSEFSEHKKYNPGDDLAQLDWKVFARTDRYYVKKFDAETNLTGYLLMDLSASMDFTHAGELTKLDYAVSLAAALAYMMVHQSDSVGLVTFDTKVRASLPPSSRRTQLSDILALLARSTASEETDIANALHQVASMIRHRSIVMVFSDLLADPDAVMKSLYHIRHRGNDVIVFHVLDESEVTFPFRGMTDFLDVESESHIKLDAQGAQAGYLRRLAEFRERYRKDCAGAGIDYVPLHTGMQFDTALVAYLAERRGK